MASVTKTSGFDKFLDTKYIPMGTGTKVGFALLVFVLICLAAWFLYFSGGQKKLKGLDSRIKTAEATLTKAKKAAARLPEVKAELARVQEKLEEAAVVLPKEREMPELLRNISDLGRRAGLEFVSFVPKPEVAKDFYSEIPLAIAIKGPYHNIGSFLDKVSKMDRLVLVDTIKMGQGKQGYGDMLLNSSCTLKTFRFTNVQVSNQGKKGKKGK